MNRLIEFKKEFIKYQRKLNLMEWRVCFKMKKLKYRYAEIDTHVNGRVATVTLTSIESEETTVRQAARHECFHLLLADLHYLAEERFCNQDEVERALETICRKLELLI